MNKETITKLLKSSNPDDNLLGLELQYKAFKRNYTNWYKRQKYNREFCKRIDILTDNDTFSPRSHFQLKIGKISIHQWFKTRLEEDFKDNML